MTNQRYSHLWKRLKIWHCPYTGVSSALDTAHTSTLYQWISTNLPNMLSPILTYWQRRSTCRVLRENNFPSQLKIKTIAQFNTGSMKRSSKQEGEDAFWMNNSSRCMLFSSPSGFHSRWASFLYCCLCRWDTLHVCLSLVDFSLFN